MHEPTRLRGRALLGVFALLTPACFGGAEVSTVIASSEATTDGGSDETTDALLITGAVLLGLSVGATVIALTVEDEDLSYLRAHQQDVRVALARGDGPFVGDLGQGLALPAELVPHLGALLRAARPALEPPLASGPVDPPKARAFATALVKILSEDATVAPYLARTLGATASRTL